MRPKKTKFSLLDWFPTLQKSEQRLPKSQNAIQTRGSAPLNILASRTLYIAQDDAGEPGRGSILPAVLGETAHFSEDGC